MHNPLLQKLSNEELDRNLQGLVRKERQTLGEILLHIHEVHRRKLYLKMSYGSLFDYLTKHLKYSAGSAQRRIDACRLSQEVPDLLATLESGELTLAQVSLVQRSFREKQKNISVDSFHLEKTDSHPGKTDQGKPDPVAQARMKNKLIQEIKQKSFAESEMIVAKSLDLQPKAGIKLNHQADESVRLEITLTKTQWQKLSQMRDLISHSLPHGSWDQALEYVADKVIASKTKTRMPKATIRSTKPELKAKSGNVSPKARASLGKLRKSVLQRDQCCQYRDRETQRLCASTWQLQADHIKPRWAGGKDELANLRALCAKHNQQMYRWQSGIGP